MLERSLAYLTYPYLSTRIQTSSRQSRTKLFSAPEKRTRESLNNTQEHETRDSAPHQPFLIARTNIRTLIRPSKSSIHPSRSFPSCQVIRHSHRSPPAFPNLRDPPPSDPTGASRSNLLPFIPSSSSIPLRNPWSTSEPPPFVQIGVAKKKAENPGRAVIRFHRSSTAPLPSNPFDCVYLGSKQVPPWNTIPGNCRR
ncbi:hypothetical protein L209DRAFT_750475 [Thermothelomyces heterothallicus CBS 203.75]